MTISAPRRPLRAATLPSAAALLLAAMSVVTDVPASAAPGSDTPSASTPAQRALARMTPDQRVGQLFLIGVPASGTPASAELRVLRDDDIGSFFLRGRSSAGVLATAKVVTRTAPAATHAGVQPLVATDQEGGNVQVLSGPGFSDIPTGLVQGGRSPSVLRSDAATWGDQLLRAGVNLDLAPVLDVVPQVAAAANQPIGRYQREYAHSPAGVTPRGPRSSRGLRAGGVLATAKHFPGIGRATGNTDDSARVTDPTTRDDSYLAPFRAAVKDEVPFVMVSSATYPAIDPGSIAAFSPTVIGGMLRGDLGFHGVVDVGLDDRRRSRRGRPGRLGALSFFGAGGDLLLSSEPDPVPSMVDAVRQRAASHAAFAQRVDEAALRVLTAKAPRRVGPRPPTGTRRLRR